MKNITRKELIENISKKTGLSQVEVKSIVESFLEAIMDSICKGKDIELRGFGRFKTKEKKARIARNPRTGEKVNVEAGVKPKFEASKEILRRMNEGFNRSELENN